MWGFTPETHGYVGFTKEGSRRSYIEACEPGDLMAVVGQRSEYTEAGDVGRMLGLVELDPVPIRDTDRMSNASYQEKIDRGWKDRWIYAMPVMKAWRIGREIKTRHIAPVTYAPNNARAIGGNALLLQPREALAVLRLPVRKVAIYGQPDWIPDAPEKTETLASVAVSHGPRPSFGERTSCVTDGETKLYVMQLVGFSNVVFRKSVKSTDVIVKIGRSNDPLRRQSELNFGFPPACTLYWTIRLTQKFASADDAHAAEQKLLSIIESKGYSIGKEFAVLPEREINGLMALVSETSAFVIHG